MFEIIDHTADIGIKVAADNLESLFLDAAEGMFAVMVESKPGLIPAITVPVDINISPENESVLEPECQLFIKWLQELLYLYETRHIVPTHFYIDSISRRSLEGCFKGLKFDKNRHKQKRQIKAVTYHQLEVGQKEGKWQAQVIFDI